MTNTGLIHRMDDLGRVVIPKELRRKMGVNVGDPLAIFYDEETKSVCFQQYVPEPFDDTEQRYLKNLLRPYFHGNMRVTVTKETSYQMCMEHIRITVKNNLGNTTFTLPPFKAGTMYEDMILEHTYTHEELKKYLGL